MMFIWILLFLTLKPDDCCGQYLDSSSFDQEVTAYMRERKIPGASVAVSKHGKFIIRKGYGRASHQRLMTPWTTVRIGGVSKFVTSLGLMRLVEHGKVRLDDLVFGEEGHSIARPAVSCDYDNSVYIFLALNQATEKQNQVL
ncbi:hypothetical protein HELRODRAFT_163397 [Helobdella robusta]|uniref:Beta-lactamase-related domain-containing protein n=1 Tax=Helobdella robusta TaxID=6412 RepID=T1EU01_HELRO|nr:hypothetical protein HELRODRAFT_163397 [Helobdella robusta]ESN96346.1 hypothetical protein HELRODRAFT_163397 [Helobdella robusta]